MEVFSLVGNILHGMDKVKRDSLTVSALACHAADPGSNPGER